jgi:uncharacterized membrane protein YhhN
MSLNALGELMTIAGLSALLLGEWKGRFALCAVGKPVASLGFLVAAIGFGAFDSDYGRIVFAGLVLGAFGDVFLLGHVAYVIAFASLGMDATYAWVTAVAMTAVMVLIARWVFPHAPEMRGPIAAYMLVIGLMCVAALGAAGEGAPWMVPVGALMFTASDIGVVRDRFVSRGFENRAIGLPLYYAAQLLIAWSIIAA